MVKQSNGMWETTIGPLAPGVYQYSFGVHGVSVVDPANQDVNETTNGLRNVVVVPGGEWTDMKNVPHGAVAEVYYYSSVLGHERRMHVYTPPGYGRARSGTRSSTCCMARATRTTRGTRSAAPGSSSTT